MAKVSVIIPFYQRTSGILRKAVASALSQKTSAAISIIVVDDESPIPARTELENICLEYPHAVTVIETKNGGPGAARNAGLDSLDPNTDFVAFLDSDDAWTPTHIEHAIQALQRGHDFYFANFFQLNQLVTAFERAGRIDVAQHPLIDPSLPVHNYQGDLFDQTLTRNIIGTSTVVYNFRKFADQRFHVEFRNAGEDYIFWLELATKCRKIAFSSEPECRYGAGVNVFSDSGWGTDKYLCVTHDLMRYKKFVLDHFSLSNAQGRALITDIRKHRIDYARGLVHNLIHNRSVDLGVVRRQLRLDPLTLMVVPSVSCALLLDKLRRPGVSRKMGTGPRP
jgi:succinoglycan biosynthesis protein ExoW